MTVRTIKKNLTVGEIFFILRGSSTNEEVVVWDCYCGCRVWLVLVVVLNRILFTPAKDGKNIM